MAKKKKIVVDLDLPKDDPTQRNFLIILFLSIMLGTASGLFWITNSGFLPTANGEPMFTNLACSTMTGDQAFNGPGTPTYAMNESCSILKDNPEVVVWEDGRLRHAGRIDMTRSGLEGFARTLRADDEVVIEPTGNAMAVSHLLRPHVARVVIANPLQVKAIAHAHVKTDKIDAGVLANLHAAGFLPEVSTPDAATERLRRLVARRN